MNISVLTQTKKSLIKRRHLPGLEVGEFILEGCEVGSGNVGVYLFLWSRIVGDYGILKYICAVGVSRERDR